MEFEGKYLKGNKWNGIGNDPDGKKAYEIKEGEGIIKEYYNNEKLNFEGEYSKGNVNGKGKIYDKNGNLNFEGEFLDGKKNGKAKIYYEDGKIRFEVEYLNNKRNGKGKKYHKNGNLKFEGEYFPNGRVVGKEYGLQGQFIKEGVYFVFD